MYTKPEYSTLEETFNHALPTQEEEGTKQQSREAIRALRDRRGEGAPSNSGGGGLLIARWGASFTTDEYVSNDVGIDHLAFECIDYGETLKLDTAMKKKLRAVEDTETKNALFRNRQQE